MRGGANGFESQLVSGPAVPPKYDRSSAARSRHFLFPYAPKRRLIGSINGQNTNSGGKNPSVEYGPERLESVKTFRHLVGIRPNVVAG